MFSFLPVGFRIVVSRYVIPGVAIALLLWEVGRASLSAAAFDSLDAFARLLPCVIIAFYLWSERRHARERRHAEQTEHNFKAAAENSLDAFYILESVRDGETILDLRFTYSNTLGEQMIGLSLSDLLGQSISTLIPSFSDGRFFALCCQVLSSGVPVDEVISGSDSQFKAEWLRARILKLGDGVAVTASDLTETRQKQRHYDSIASFSESIFENAPFSILATDAEGTITAMNKAAETLSLYKRAELIGSTAITTLHDPRELAARAEQLPLKNGNPLEGFQVLCAKALRGEVEEREWTYIRKDGTSLPINLAVTSIRANDGTVEGFVWIAADITDRRQMLSYVTHLATHDHLTGLMDRTLLRQRLLEAVNRARSSNRKVAVFVLDLDQFKRINDSLGHQAGDNVLREAALRLRNSVRAADTVARMGGDEFVAVLPDIKSIEDVERFARDLVKRLGGTMPVKDHDIQITASVGVCVYPDFATSADELMERADTAMYAAKQAGKNQHQVFNEAMLKETSSRISLESELRQALANGEFSLVYQPQVCLETSEIIGMEALLRWSNPRLGDVSPADFIPLAEETGLIVPIGEWVIRQACVEGKQLGEALGRDLCVAINLSPRQFQQTNLLETISGALSHSGLAPGNLEIEITENTLMINSAVNLATLQSIRELGAKLAIDDFGTGFCSFSYLLEYKVDRLKIDQSFVRRAVVDANAAAVVRTIIAMSHGLNIRVVAEGVETPEQLQFLRRRRCDEAQGYLFARPVAARDFVAASESIGTERRRFLSSSSHLIPPPPRLARQRPRTPATSSSKVSLHASEQAPTEIAS